MNERKIVIPGELIEKGTDFLPGENVGKSNEGIIALKYGLAEIQDKLVKVIPISGVYEPRRGNVVIGKVQEINFNGWNIDIGAPEHAFLSLMEVPRYVDKNKLYEVMDIGDVTVAKIWNINQRGIDLSLKSRGLGRIEDGIIVEVNSNKVPRIIGKEGSMIKLIKDSTNCDITVGQNGFVWIQGDTTEEELFAKKAILFVAQKSITSGLTKAVEKWFAENRKAKSLTTSSAGQSKGDKK